MISQITDHLWQSTLFALAAGVLTLAFRRNRAKVRFWLWLSASLKFFIPFALLMNLGSSLQWSPAAHQGAAQIATPAVSFAVEYVAQPFSETASLARSTPRATDWIPSALLVLWACGFLMVVLIRLKLWFRIRNAVRASTPLEIPSPVGVRSSPELLEPGVVGLLNPVLLLPAGITERLTASQLEAVLAHELCHVRRRDNLFASVHMIVEAVFWFHPLVWWIGARLVDERERACDEDVLSLGNQPRVYADAILNVCKLYAESPLVCVSGVTGSNIRRRIEAIMTNRKGQTLNRAKKFLLAAAGFAALVGPVVTGVVIGLGHLPAIHAQVPMASPPVPKIDRPAPLQMAQLPTANLQPAPTPAAATPEPAERRVVAMLFDFSTMTPDEQARAQAAGITFVQNDLKPVDRVTVMLASGGRGPIRILQDFTDNPALLQSALQDIINEAGRGSLPGVEGRLRTISTVSKMLGGFPGKKALMYYAAAITQFETDNQAELRDAIDTAKKANVAIFPIDVRGAGPGRAAVTPPSAYPVGGVFSGSDPADPRIYHLVDSGTPTAQATPDSTK